MSTTTHPTAIDAAGTHAITIQRDFDHPVDTVFRAMTDPELVARWIGPKNLENLECTSNPRHGGGWTLVQRDPDGTEHAFRGVFHGEPTAELSVRTFEWLGMPGHVSLESLRLEDLGDGRTRAHSTAVFLTTEDRDGMLGAMPSGVIDGYERLDDVLAGL